MFVESHWNELFSTRFNPFYHLGSLIIFNLLILTVTGTYMFIYYSPSVETVYESVRYVNEEAFLGSLTRSVHQYSSDLMLVLMVLHMIRVFAQDKYRKYRWIAWTSGVAMLFFNIIEGVTGHIMTWNSRAHLIVNHSAKLLAAMKVFGEDLPRAFSSEALLSTWIMWILLAIHLLIPIAFIFLIYIHLSRISRSRFFGPRGLMLGTLGLLIVFSLLFPVEIHEKADLMSIPVIQEIDWFYLFLLPVFEHANTYTILAGTALILVFLLAAPWYRGKLNIDVADRDLSHCTGCAACAKDCPYEAIYMRSRTDGQKYRMESVVLDDRCAGCGICVGSCSFGGMSLTSLRENSIEEHLDSVLSSSGVEAKPRFLGIFCENSISESGILDESGKNLQAEPRLQVLKVPCAGMVGPGLINMALERGSAGIVIAACRENDCYFREGNLWLRDRLKAKRVPKVRLKDEEKPVAALSFSAIEGQAFVKEVTALLDGWTHREQPPSSRGSFISLKHGRRGISAMVIAAFSGLFLFGFAWGALDPWGDYSQSPRARIKLNFFHLSDMVSCDLQNLSGAVAEVRSRIDHVTRMDNIPKEGRDQRISSNLVSAMLCPREREPVHIRLRVDEQIQLEKTFMPTGFKHDGLTYVSHEIELKPGAHKLSLNMKDSSSPKRREGIDFHLEQTLAENQVLFIDFNEELGKFYIRK